MKNEISHRVLSLLLGSTRWISQLDLLSVQVTQILENFNSPEVLRCSKMLGLFATTRS
jgi:hypothetical protein